MFDLHAAFYSFPFACFQCRKSHKIVIKRDTPRPFAIHCPECGGPLRYLGRYFKAPPRRNVKQWRKLQFLYQNGWRATGYDGDVSTLRAAKAYVRDKPLKQKLERQQQIQSAQKAKWRNMRKWPRVHL